MSGLTFSRALLGTGVVLVSALSPVAETRAAEVTLHAADACVSRDEIVDQVDELLGRRLAEVGGMDFDVALQPIAGRAARKAWRVEVVTIPRDGASRRSREIEGDDCAELADAAAVAIAMSVKGESPEPPRRPPSTAPVDVVAARAGGSSREGDAVKEPRPSVVAVGVGALGDAATLPGVGLGLGLGGMVRWPRLVLHAQLELFPAREISLADRSGGSFRLLGAALQACFSTPTAAVDLLLCGGGEVGAMQGEGTGVSSPRLRTVAWEAGRLELGAVRKLTPTFLLFLHGGVVLPWSRPTFRLNDTVDVFRPAGVAGRLTLEGAFELF